jgi:hypothetical protein
MMLWTKGFFSPQEKKRICEISLLLFQFDTGARLQPAGVGPIPRLEATVV